MRSRLAPLVAVFALAAAGCGAGTASQGDAAAGVPRASVDRFDAARAFAEVRRQVAMGPRPAGSAASRRLAARLRRALPAGRFEAVPGGLRNVVGRLPARGRGVRGKAIVVAAHYDTKDLPGFVGANDGAAGTATVLELARALARRPAPADRLEVRFVLFDGEEEPPGSTDFLTGGLRGSRAYLAAHRRELGAVIVVDFVGNRRLSLPREDGSHRELWAQLRAAARRVGVGSVFPPRRRPEILDDHTPFMRAGIPAIDLIDFDYPPWHTPEDTLDKVSARSLDAAGEAVLELLVRLRAG
jgi:Zn-dependent M28 family amino/carboxypeptidase